MYSEQGQIEELGLKANVEFKIQTINFRGDRTLRTEKHFRNLQSSHLVW